MNLKTELNIIETQKLEHTVAAEIQCNTEEKENLDEFTIACESGRVCRGSIEDNDLSKE